MSSRSGDTGETIDGEPIEVEGKLIQAPFSGERLQAVGALAIVAGILYLFGLGWAMIALGVLLLAEGIARTVDFSRSTVYMFPDDDEEYG